jgi:upstream activation factor subunit UAF30
MSKDQNKGKKSKSTNSENNKNEVTSVSTPSPDKVSLSTVQKELMIVNPVSENNQSSDAVPTVDTTIDVTNEIVSEESNTDILFNKLINQFQDIQLVMKTLQSNLKILQKEVSRERKESKKKESKIKKKSDKKKSPSGFAKPSPITPELSNFLGIPLGEHIARTDVTSKVIAYVKEHNLQNPQDKRSIDPDEKLKNLLQPGDLQITYFNLQTHLKKHFLPNPVTTEPTVTSVPSSV